VQGDICDRALVERITGSGVDAIGFCRNFSSEVI
jgi:hypothetical protein